MSVIFDGKLAAKKVLQEAKTIFQNSQQTPKLAIILSESSSACRTFASIKRKTGDSVGIDVSFVDIPADFDTEHVCSLVKESSRNVDGVLVQLPLPKRLDTLTILNSIPYEKDVEGLSSRRIGESLQDVNAEIRSPVARAVLHALRDASDTLDRDLRKENAVLIGFSDLIGKPLVEPLSKLCNSVTICRSHTKNLIHMTSSADILITGAGVPDLITAQHVNSRTIVIDAGYTKTKTGKISGDVDPTIVPNVTYITPVPGGIGPLTVAYIFQNLGMLMSTSTKG